MSGQNFGMRPGIILLREGTDTSQVRIVESCMIVDCALVHHSTSFHVLLLLTEMSPIPCALLPCM